MRQNVKYVFYLKSIQRRPVILLKKMHVLSEKGIVRDSGMENIITYMII